MSILNSEVSISGHEAGADDVAGSASAATKVAMARRFIAKRWSSAHAITPL